MTNDFDVLMQIFSVPRHNGSKALEQTFHAIENWLTKKNIPFNIQEFPLYPNLFVTIGLWLIISRSILAVSIWLQWGWITFIIAIISLVGGFVDIAFDFHLISWVGKKVGNNIIIQLSPKSPKQELILSAHYDTKTELLDHHQRMFFLKNIPTGIFLTLLIGILGPIGSLTANNTLVFHNIVYLIGILLTIPLLFLAFGLGINLSFGWMRKPSQGAVDNGAACAILLALGNKIKQEIISLKKTKITLLLFTGEEVNMQGSNSYVKQRKWDLPVVVYNLEVMAQNGKYVFWENDGTVLKLIPTDQKLNRIFTEVVQENIKSKPVAGGPINSDGGAFLRRNIPATTIGTYDKLLRDRGFHSSKDNIYRVMQARLPEGVELLSTIIERIDSVDIETQWK